MAAGAHVPEDYTNVSTEMSSGFDRRKSIKVSTLREFRTALSIAFMT